MPKSDFADKKTLISEFNEAGYQIARLHYIWSQCNYHAIFGNLLKWKWNLDRAWVELYADAQKKNKTKYEAELKVLNEKITMAKNKSELYQALQDKETFLRTLQDDVGKGSKRQEEYDRVM